MHPRLFRLIETLQRIDEQLRRAERRADRLEMGRLRLLKLKAKFLARRFLARVPARG